MFINNAYYSVVGWQRTGWALDGEKSFLSAYQSLLCLRKVCLYNKAHIAGSLTFCWSNTFCLFVFFLIFCCTSACCITFFPLSADKFMIYMHKLAVRGIPHTFYELKKKKKKNRREKKKKKKKKTLKYNKVITQIIFRAGKFSGWQCIIIFFFFFFFSPSIKKDGRNVSKTTSQPHQIGLCCLAACSRASSTYAATVLHGVRTCLTLCNKRAVGLIARLLLFFLILFLFSPL